MRRTSLSRLSIKANIKQGQKRISSTSAVSAHLCSENRILSSCSSSANSEKI